MMMSKKASTIKDRYGKGYVTDEQLGRYYNLEVITLSEYEEILASKQVQEEQPEEEHESSLA